jgi:hypothetical protein
MNNLNENYLKEQAVPVPRMELSDRFKEVIKELVITHENLSNAISNVTDCRPDAIKMIEPCCHKHSIEVIEDLARQLEVLSDNLHRELK